jgi:4'-phosphopantetheinyl transferase
MPQATLDRFAPPPPEIAAPAAGEIHVWTVPLDPPAAEVAALRALLAADEIARADRFRFDRHRRRFTVGRGVLRTLLGRYLGLPPRAVGFRYGPNDKPYLDAPPAGGLEFNLSNSEELAVVAVTAGEEVGADVERLRPMADALAIAERFFSAAERRVLAAVPEAEREPAFFRAWTRKEAYLKAVGTGITVPLDRFDVSLAADEAPRILAMEGDPARAAAWSLFHLEPAAGYLGAVAIRGAGWRLSGWRWSGWHSGG